MDRPLAAAIAVSAAAPSASRWREALSALTPATIAVVAALMLARILSASLGNILADAAQHGLGPRIAYLFARYLALLLMAVPIVIAVVATSALGPRSAGKRVAAQAAAVVVSSGVGVVLRIGIEEAAGLVDGWPYVREMLRYVWPRYAVLGALFAIAYEFYRRELNAVRAMQQAEVDRAAFEREMSEARLQVLRAQIEPHFLFNTLANVRRLFDRDRAAGRAMLESLMCYLENSLPSMRDRESTLGRDAELAAAFLRVHQVRMGRRLGFDVDVPASLLGHPMPPMMLLTLVENAIKHGLNPSPQGGLLRVAARREAGELIVDVADTGVGFASGSGDGTGLANLRARLAAQFGERARLALRNNELGGVTATIVLPYAAGAEAA